MARYSCSFSSPQSCTPLSEQLDGTFEKCNVEIIYDDPVYLVGRELPGQVSFSRLVTVEALIDQPKSNKGSLKINCVVKNEELPLNQDNHCRRMFDEFKKKVQEHTSWKLN